MREILWGLAAEGLLMRQAGKGFTVRTLDWKQLNEVYEVREGFEGLAARLCCRKLTAKGKKRLLELKKKLERLNKNIDEEGVRLGRVLHRFIMDEADSSLLNELYGKIGNLIRGEGFIPRGLPRL
jgi:DNA-binding GntR family transcriptional regulator